jgi:hypothetical protein
VLSFGSGSHGAFWKYFLQEKIGISKEVTSLEDHFSMSSNDGSCD